MHSVNNNIMHDLNALYVNPFNEFYHLHCDVIVLVICSCKYSKSW